MEEVAQLLSGWLVECLALRGRVREEVAVTEWVVGRVSGNERGRVAEMHGTVNARVFATVCTEIEGSVPG